MSAVGTMIAHRYGNNATSNPSTSGMPAAGLSGRERRARQAALELKQALDTSGTAHQIKKLSKPGSPTAYTFAFALPLEQAIQQFSAQALQIATRHGTSVAFLPSFLDSSPRAVLVIANDPILAHIAYKTPFGPTG